MKTSTIGLDIAKNVCQVHGVDVEGRVAIGKKLRRGAVLGFFAGLEPCLVGVEASCGAHHWARELAALGHDVRLLPSSYVKGYLKRGKNDAVDAEAICEAVTRPSMRFVPVKSTAQQVALVPHRVRDVLVRQRTLLLELAEAIAALQPRIASTEAAMRTAVRHDPLARALTTIPGYRTRQRAMNRPLPHTPVC